jgi:hypothetical protein
MLLELWVVRIGNVNVQGIDSLKENGVQNQLINVKRYFKRNPVLKLQKKEKKKGLKRSQRNKKEEN